MSECKIPPIGWRCTRPLGHEGPCAAIPSNFEPSMSRRRPLRFRHVNHEGVAQDRALVAPRVEYGTSPFHPGVEGWFLVGYDMTRDMDERSFPFTDLLQPAEDDLITAGVPRSGKWPAVRKRHLELEPACAACGTKKLLNVHHVRPFHLFPELELEDTNLITLCESPSHNCHLIHGHLLSWRSYNLEVRQHAAEFLARVRGRL